MRLTKLTNDTICFLVKIYECNGAPTTVDELKKNCDISTGQAAIICKYLKQSNIIGTVRGRTGGVFLKKDPREIRIAPLIISLETRLRPIGCYATDSCNTCTRYGGRVFCDSLARSLDAFFRELGDKSLHDLCQPAESCPEQETQQTGHPKTLGDGKGA
ncbi:Rrf2 family transcriptional regulator [Roseibium sp.]|uniref:Rrf2 family transcriptional regulator n=1 Tax=Roseibium sp. TaxID=1936156 RepID=UPI003B508A3D